LAHTLIKKQIKTYVKSKKKLALSCIFCLNVATPKKRGFFSMLLLIGKNESFLIRKYCVSNFDHKKVNFWEVKNDLSYSSGVDYFLIFPPEIFEFMEFMATQESLTLNINGGELDLLLRKDENKPKKMPLDYKVLSMVCEKSKKLLFRSRLILRPDLEDCLLVSFFAEVPKSKNSTSQITLEMLFNKYFFSLLNTFVSFYDNKELLKKIDLAIEKGVFEVV
jgi:hypothetical protein